jgi:hypothetical protein
MALHFVTTFVNNFPGPEQQAFQKALDTWSAALDSNQEIDVTAIWGATLINNLTAICIPNAIEDFQNSPVASTWYPSALADKLANQDLQPQEEDLTVFFSNAYNWNAGPGNPGGNQLDLESVALHELGHGLGMVGVFLATGWPWVGSYGSQHLIGLAQQVVQQSGQGQYLGFQLPNLNNHPSIYGLQIQNANGDYLTDPNQYANPSNQLGAQLISGNVFADVNHTQVYAPNPFIPFTSIDHLNNANSLMRPSIQPGQHVRQIDQPVLDIMHALGW